METNNNGNTEMPFSKQFFVIVVFIICLFQIHSTFANSQDYRYKKSAYMKHFSLADGLSQNTGSDIIQDSEGYIWIATDDGVNRFDGHEFEIFRHDHKNSNSLHDSGVISLMEEPGKGIWIGTVSGPSFFDLSTGTFFDYSKSLPELQTYIFDFNYSDNGIVWLASNNGLFYLDRQNSSTFLPYKSPDSKQITSDILSIAQSADYIYAGGVNCIYRINTNDFSLVDLCEHNSFSELKLRNVSILKLLKESLWIGTDKGLFEYKLVDKSLYKYINDKDDSSSISNNVIMDIAVDENDLLWIATDSGLSQYSKEKNKFLSYEKSAYPDGGIVSNDILSLFIDRRNLIWIGTNGSGINLYDPLQKKFERLFSNSDALTVSIGNQIHGIEKDSFDTLWMAVTASGLVNYDLMTGELSRPLSGLQNKEDLDVYSLFIDSDNRLWAGGYSKLVLVDINTKLEIETNFYLEGLSIPNLKGVSQVYEDLNGEIWIVGIMGMYKVSKIDVSENRLEIWLDNLTSKLPKSYTDRLSSISQILDDQDGNIWVGGDSGLLYYNVSKDSWQHFTYDEKNQHSLSHDSVHDIFKDSSNFIWIGTGNGLNRVVRNDSNKDEFYFERITTREGLPNNLVYGILEDRKQNLWFSTNLGLVEYSGKEASMKSYRQSDGISSDEFNTGSTFKDSEGRLYFGSINGITVVHPVGSRFNADATDLKFSGVKVGSREINAYNLSKSSNPKIVQRDDESSIKISIANIDFRKSDNQSYRYRLLGLDPNWSYLRKNREIFLTGLQEGEYLLEVQAQLANQKWSERTKHLGIVVETNFWKSSKGLYLFLFLIGLFFLTSIIFIIQHYRKKMRVVTNRKELETLRRKEMRMNNDSLTSQLNRAEKNIISLTNSLTKTQEKLGYKNYWDVVTGFYKISYLDHVEEKKFAKELSSDSKTSESYKFLCILELNNVIDVYNEFGTLASENLLGEVSKTIRKLCEASAQIFKIDSGRFLILSSCLNYGEFEESIIQLKNTIIRTEYEVANGITRTTKASLTLLDAAQVNILDKSDFINLINYFISLSSELTGAEHQNDRRITASSGLIDYLNELEHYDLNEMIQSKLIDIDLI